MSSPSIMTSSLLLLLIPFLLLPLISSSSPPPSPPSDSSLHTSPYSPSFYPSLSTSPPFSVYWLSECGCTGVEKEGVALSTEIMKYFALPFNSSDPSPSPTLWSSFPSTSSSSSPSSFDSLRYKLSRCSLYLNDTSDLSNDHYIDGRCPGYRKETNRYLLNITKIYGQRENIPLLLSHIIPISVVVIHLTNYGLCGFPHHLLHSVHSYNSLVHSYYVQHDPSSPLALSPVRPYYIARIFGESNDIDDISMDKCMKYYDEFWVPTQFYGEILTRRMKEYKDKERKKYSHNLLSVPDEKSKMLSSPHPIIVLPKSIDMYLFHQKNPQISPIELFPDPFATPSAPLLPTNSPYPPHPGPRPKPNFIFLSLFKWEIRKDWKSLLASFLMAFPSPEFENVKLYIHTIPFDQSNPIEEATAFLVNTLHYSLSHVQNQILVHRIKLSVRTSPLPESSLPSLYSSAHSFVLCSHGEGWNLPLLEAMSMSLPVITMNFSGPSEFTTRDIAYYVNYTMVNVGKEREWEKEIKVGNRLPSASPTTRESHHNAPSPLSLYEKHGNIGQWAQVDLLDFQSKLLHVYNNYNSEVSERRERMTEWVRNKFNPKRVGRMFAKRLKEIETEMEERNQKQKKKEGNEGTISQHNEL